jgi:thioesterase domain-containing protein/aryl carrier-like protein
VERVGRHDHFFELGGHSLLAVQMVNLLKQAHIDIMVADLFAHPTIESLATLATRDVRQSKQAWIDTAIGIRKEGAEHPLFLLPHGGPGELVYASILTPHLDPNIPVFALPSHINAPCEAGGEPLLRTMQAMAARMVRMTRSVQPVGPYRIAGRSYGGTLAYEVAKQLIDNGQIVEFLGMFDSQYVTGKTAFPGRPKDERGQLLHEIGWWASSDGNLLSKLGDLKSKAAAMDFDCLLRTCEEMSLLPGHLTQLGATEIQHYLAGQYALYVAKIQYHAQPISIPIHLFAAQDGDTTEDVDTTDPLRGWGAVLPKDQIRVISVAGTHATMFDSPNLEPLGNALSCAIRNVRTDTRELLEISGG